MITFFLLLKLFAVMILAEDKNTTSSSEPSKLIYYGKFATIEEFPFFAGLDKCGAVILSEIWILTAAHCVANKPTWVPKNVWVGGTTREDSIKVACENVIVHEHFNNMYGALINDIALLKLSTLLKFSSKIQPVKLPIGKPTSKDLVLVGKGLTETGINPRYLQKVNLIELPMRECIFTLTPKQYQDFLKQNLVAYERSNICTRRAVNLPAACYGDSGSPLVSGRILVGLASHLDQKGQKPWCNKTRLNFFTNVSTYVPWIRQHTDL